MLESSSVPDYDAAVRACPRRGGPRCDFGNHGARTIAVFDGPLRVETVVQAGYGRKSRSSWSWSENFRVAGRLPLRPLSLARARFSPSVPMPCSFPRASSRCRAGSLFPTLNEKVRVAKLFFPAYFSLSAGDSGQSRQLPVGGPELVSSQSGVAR